MAVDGATRAEGLLEQIADTALDDDYYVVRSGTDPRSREFNTVLTAVVLAVFAVLVATAALQTRNDRPATQQERATLIADITARKAALAKREATAASLRTEVESLGAAVVRFDPDYQALRLEAADQAATGPGLTVRVAPSADGGVDGQVTDTDLQVLVNTLWYAGAEAVAVDGQRIGSLTSIRTAGGVVKVNFRAVAPPYVIEAIGGPESLQDRFEGTDVGASWVRRRDGAGVRFEVARSSVLTLDAASQERLTIRKATAIKEDG